MNNRILPAEWAIQDAVLIAWPHSKTDWAPMLDEARSCFKHIIEAIASIETVILLFENKDDIIALDEFTNKERIHPVICQTNDTWARDFGPIFVLDEHHKLAIDFKFNGWGLKFPSDKDNLTTSHLFENGIFASNVTRENKLNFVLEGGSIESDGKGTILTTTECLMSSNRNGGFSRGEIEKELKQSFGAQRILWIDYGYLAGDDTDSHVDTLARFCNPETIAYVKCTNSDDEHFEALKKMEEQLHSFKTSAGHPYQLIPLPMPDPIFSDRSRLPATYANFLIINNAVLVPFYHSPKDEEAREKLQKAFPNREVKGIDCRALIKQHGSLHCVTMQLPKNTINWDKICKD